VQNSIGGKPGKSAADSVFSWYFSHLDGWPKSPMQIRGPTLGFVIELLGRSSRWPA
jgi:hypothetical protein